MNITSFKITGTGSVNLPIAGASSSDRYMLKGADGLGPTEIDVIVSKGVHVHSSPRDRELVIRIGLNPEHSTGETASDLRTEMYQYLRGVLTFSIIDNLTELMKVNGTLKKCEIVPFTKDPEVQVTISCFGPYFEAPAPVNVNLGTLSKTFPVIENIGTAPSGMYFELEFTENIGSLWTLARVGGDENQLLLSDFSFLTGDNLVFITIPGSKNVYIQRSSTSNPISLLSFMGTSVTTAYIDPWLLLEPGINTFDTWDARFNWVDVHYTPQYLGI